MNMMPDQIGENKKKWPNLIPLFLALIVLTEIALLSRLDLAYKSSLVNSLANSFYPFTALWWFFPRPDDDPATGSGPEPENCEAWLEREDSVAFSYRDFNKDPIFIYGITEDLESCAVRCNFRYQSEKKADAAIGLDNEKGAPGVLRSMESTKYYKDNDIDTARRLGYSVVMTTSLSSDVPVGYFSWAEYDIMAPLEPKTEKALAAAFISNCESRNFRMQALKGLEKSNIVIDSYGSCHRNRDGRVNKVETLKRYKFSLAFENSNEEDYVTEKYFQSLVAGTIPVVVGAPNIQDFAPSPGAVLHIKALEDIDSVAKMMAYLAEHPDTYNQSLRWKFEGPSDSFKALIDMAAVHSSCRLCIFLATLIREKEEKHVDFPKRPCKCTKGLDTVYHIYVRERGRFEMESIFLRSRNLTLEALEAAVLLKFNAIKHVPIWKESRPKSIRGTDELKMYKIYPLGLTQRQALFMFNFKEDYDLRSHLENNPCTKFEAIFV